jgi:O-antigen/teichoic acid export membrane protein
MGKIAKQSVQGSVYNYIGAVLGFLSAGLLMPKFLSPEQVGLINLLVAVTLIFSSFSTLGFNSILTRMFPYFRSPAKSHNGILSLGVLVVTAGISLTLIVFFVFQDSIITEKPGESPLLRENYLYIPVLIIFASLFSLLDTYNRMLYDAVSGILFREVIVRVLNLILIVLFIFEIISFGNFVLYYVLAYNSPTLLIALVLIFRGEFYISRPNWRLMRQMRKEMFSVAFFGILTVFSSLAVMNIDKYMINYYLGLSATGIYSVSFYFATLILIPSRAIRKISGIFIADAWKENKPEQIQLIYKKSSINMLLIGVLLFVGIWANIENIFKILPEYSAGRYVILFIGLANIFEMASGVSSGIISSSKNYKVHAYIMLFMIAGIVVSNIIFIPLYGLTGGALASLIAVFLTAVLRFLFLLFRYGFQPYRLRHIYILLTGAMILFMNQYIPQPDNFYLDILLRSSIISIVFALIAYFGKFSEDANELADRLFAVIARKIKDE